MSHISNDINQRVASQMPKPIFIDDDEDEDEVQEIPKPAQRRSTQTPGMFMTPHPWELVGTSSGRQTADLTAEPEPGPLCRDRSRGTTDSGGLFVRQPHSESNSSPTPVSRGASVQIDLTLSDDEDETTDHEKASYQKKEDDHEDKASHATFPMGEPRGVKRPRSSSTTASEPTDNHKRQMTDVRCSL